MRLEDKLNKLVVSGVISKWQVQNISDEGRVGEESKFRNTERLTLEFPNGEKLVIGTFCSGCAENTSFALDQQ